MQKTTTNIEKLVSIGAKNIPSSLKEKFTDALSDTKVGKQSIFLLWIVNLVVARPKKFMQMCRDLQEEIDQEEEVEEKLNLTN
ncbi:hypothetical protein [Bernardetia sp.]|uniref:hypothetical protein n=1 Tax=Bernardetia sp. TaxID=1937974 RepID=UPI0025B8B404|nr:hypothetical protein [Bernardetia sp.]